jgi:RNA polymerase sigma-70 factor (sigma-E family)
MHAQSRDAAFTDYVRDRSGELSRTAYLLCAGDRHRAEDLVQTALTKLYLAWGRVRDPKAVDGYARRILVRAAIDDSRRGWRRESPTDAFAHEPVTEDAAPSDPVLLGLLRELPPGQRAAVVLRYWNDLSVDDTARLMGCTPSTVKTQAARGLARLRDALAGPDLRTCGDPHGR